MKYISGISHTLLLLYIYINANNNTGIGIGIMLEPILYSQYSQTYWYKDQTTKPMLITHNDI